MLQSNFKGFSLFNDVEDEQLQTFNRARILVNIAQDNTKDKKITFKGSALVLGYFNSIPEKCREAVKNEFAKLMQKEGYALVG